VSEFGTERVWLRLAGTTSAESVFGWKEPPESIIQDRKKRLSTLRIVFIEMGAVTEILARKAFVGWASLDQSFWFDK
jgi:hypothetical protein